MLEHLANREILEEVPFVTHGYLFGLSLLTRATLRGRHLAPAPRHSIPPCQVRSELRSSAGPASAPVACHRREARRSGGRGSVGERFQETRVRRCRRRRSPPPGDDRQHPSMPPPPTPGSPPCRGTPPLPRSSWRRAFVRRRAEPPRARTSTSHQRG